MGIRSLTYSESEEFPSIYFVSVPSIRPLMMELLFKRLSYDSGSYVQLALVFAISLLLASIIRKRFHYLRYNLPPGPFSLPIVGHLPFMKNDRHLYYIELAKKYGNIFSFYLGDKLFIVLNDIDLIQQAYSKDSFLGRPPDTSFVPHTPGTTELNGPKWKEQRRLMLRVLKELGLGRTEGSSISGKSLSDMVSGFVEKLRRYEGQVVQVRTIINHEMNSTMYKMTTGYTLDEGTELARDIEEYQWGFDVYAMTIYATYLCPIFKPIAFLFNTPGKTCLKSILKVAKFFNHVISRHENDPAFSTKNDFINMCLQQTKKDHMKSNSRQALLADAVNLTTAGTQGIPTNLEFMLLQMVQYPDVQKKVYEEISNVLGNKRVPEWSDSNQMPYTLAVFWEVLRYANFFPVNESRYVLEDDNLGGYDVPKGTGVVIVSYSVHMDPKIWGDPERFRPERFLSEDGKLLNDVIRNVMTFAKGKRKCPGETLTKMSVFLYFAATVQAFEILPPEEGVDTSVSFLLSAKLNNASFVFKSRD